MASLTAAGLQPIIDLLTVDETIAEDDRLYLLAVDIVARRLYKRLDGAQNVTEEMVEKTVDAIPFKLHVLWRLGNLFEDPNWSVADLFEDPNWSKKELFKDG